MKIFSFFCKLAFLTLVLSLTLKVEAQSSTEYENIECHIVGFKFGTIFPSNRMSFETLPSGTTSQNATMYSLYKSPWLNFGVTGFYKYKSNWLVSLDADMWFGSDNLKHRVERMSDIFTRDSIIIGDNGTDAVATCYNRGLSFKAGLGKIIPLAPDKNPNSGLLARVNGGWMFQQTVFMLNEAKAPQLDGDYALLYDHQRQGFLLSEGIGFWFMSNRANLINFYIEFEVSECWSKSTRGHIIDNYLGVNGKDNNKYFDLFYTIKLSWMFPLKGKKSYDYYYY